MTQQDKWNELCEKVRAFEEFNGFQNLLKLNIVCPNLDDCFNCKHSKVCDEKHKIYPTESADKREALEELVLKTRKKIIGTINPIQYAQPMSLTFYEDNIGWIYEVIYKSRCPSISYKATVFSYFDEDDVPAPTRAEALYSLIIKLCDELGDKFIAYVRKVIEA